MADPETPPHGDRTAAADVLSSGRTADVNDLLANTLAASLGYQPDPVAQQFDRVLDAIEATSPPLPSTSTTPAASRRRSPVPRGP